MKYLKSFKSVNLLLVRESLSDNDYYWRISIVEYIDKLKYSIIDMSEEMIDKIKSLSKSTLKFERLLIFEISKRKYLTNNSMDKSLYCIYELPDEWYMVRMYNEYYLCDRFDGLEKLLSDFSQSQQNMYRNIL